MHVSCWSSSVLCKIIIKKSNICEICRLFYSILKSFRIPEGELKGDANTALVKLFLKDCVRFIGHIWVNRRKSY